MKISRRLIFFLFSLALVLAFPGCGDGGDEQSLASLDHTDTDFIRAKEAQINALEEVLGRAGDGTKPDIIVVNFQRELMYSKSLGLQAFPENVGHSSPQSALLPLPQYGPKKILEVKHSDVYLRSLALRIILTQPSGGV